VQELAAAFASWRDAVGDRDLKAANAQAAADLWCSRQLSAGFAALADNRHAMQSLRKVCYGMPACSVLCVAHHSCEPREGHVVFIWERWGRWHAALIPSRYVMRRSVSIMM